MTNPVRTARAHWRALAAAASFAAIATTASAATLTASTFKAQTAAQATFAAAPVFAPDLQTVPQISGSAQVDEPLHADPGAWSRNPTSYDLQWLRCDTDGESCAQISTATNATYTPVSADQGHRLRVKVTASNAGGDSQPARSDATDVVIAPRPGASAPPIITGAARNGDVLSTSTGTWSNSPTSYAYRWRRCDTGGAACVDIASATSSTYTLQGADIGFTIRVQVTASNAYGQRSQSSAATSAVLNMPAPVNQTVPAISGPTFSGQTLTADPGTWTNNPTTYAYQWRRCDTDAANCQAIHGATSQTYQLAAADEGNTIRVRVTASNAGGSGQSDSDATATVRAPAPAPTPSAPPAITGQPYVAVTLTATNGTWSGTVTGYQRQWLRCDTAGANCQPISGATGQSYTAAPADSGSTLRVAVQAVNDGTVSATQTSAATATITTVSQLTVSLGVTPSSIAFSCCADAGAYYTDTFNASTTNVWRFTYANVPAGWTIKSIRATSQAGNSGYASQTHRLYNDSTVLSSVSVPAGAGQDCTYGCGWGNFVNYSADSGWQTLASPLPISTAQTALRLEQVADQGWRAFTQAPTAQAIVVP